MTREEIKRGMYNSIHRWDKHREISLTALVGLIMRDLDEKGVVIKGDSLGGSHPHLCNYYTVEPLIEENETS